MRSFKALALGLFLALTGVTGAFAQCGTQAPANSVCGNFTGGQALAGYKPVSSLIAPLTPGTTPIVGGTSHGILTNNAGLLGNTVAGVSGQAFMGSTGAEPGWSSTPTLGIPGTTAGQLGLAGLTSGTAILRAQAIAGSAVSLLPTAAGTLVGTSAAPLAIDAATGQISITGLAGGVLAGSTPAFTRTPTLGASGTLGSITFGNATSGLVTVQPVAGALGTVIIGLPAAAGTFAVSATSPLVLGATSGALTCPTCVTSSGGGAISGTAPISVSAAGVVSITSPLPLTNGGTNASLTANNGGIVWSNASQLQIFAGTATARLPLLSGATATPSWGAFTLPASVTSGGVACYTSTTAESSSALLASNGLMIGGGAGVCPSAITAGTNGQLLLGVTSSPPQMATMSQDCSITNAGLITCTKTNNVSFGPAATAAQGQILGIATNTVASAGNIGEFTSASVATPGSALTSGAAQNVTSITLAAGAWDIQAVCGYSRAATTVFTLLICSISTTTGVLDTSNALRFIQQAPNTASPSGPDWSMATTNFRVNISGSTTYFLVTRADFITSTAGAFGAIRATRPF